jgi:hypothetical protein
MSDLQHFLSQRQAPLTALFESGDIDRILTFYDPDLTFSDHGAAPFPLRSLRDSDIDL